MNSNLKDNNWVNYIIKNELKFDSISSLSIDIIKKPQPVVTVRLRRGNHDRSNVVSRQTCMWYIGANKSTIKRKHTKHYKR